MKEINEIKKYLINELYKVNLFDEDDTEKMLELIKQIDNANKVAAKLQGAIDIFKEIEEL